MRLAVREVLELAERCFAAAGFPEGPARAAAESVWWTELYRGSGLETLHTLLPDLPEWDPDALRIADRSAFVSVVDGSTQPSLVASTPAVDLACAGASRHGVGVVHVGTDPADGTVPTLGHAAYAAAERGLLSVVLATGGDGRPRTILGRPDDPHPVLAERELDSPSAGHAELSAVISWGAYDRRDNPLTQAFFTGAPETEYGTAGERLLDRLLQQSTAPSGGEADVDPGFTVLCLDPDHSRHSGDLRRVVDRFVDERAAALTRTFRPAEISDRAGAALENGVVVEEAVWRDIFDRSSEVLAPEFEGSYRGAGFNINE
jgi:LDH2 family malate/lactate/ureidoglycolate dehydrogenase